MLNLTLSISVTTVLSPRISKEGRRLIHIISIEVRIWLLSTAIKILIIVSSTLSYKFKICFLMTFLSLIVTQLIKFNLTYR